MNITLRQLRVFVAVAAHGSFSRAAGQIGLSQSATSLSLKELEDELGLKLLDRTTRQVRLTAVGETFLATANRLLAELDATLRDVRSIGEQRRGRVAVSVAPSIAAQMMPACMWEAQKRYRHLQVQLQDDASRDVTRKVIAGEVDFGITSGPLSSSEMVTEHLFDDPFCLVCPAAHPLARKKIVRWRDLDGERLVMLDNTSGSRRLIESALAGAAVEVEVVLDLAQPGSVIAMVKSGFGISVLPRLAAPHGPASELSVRQIAEPDLSRSIALIRPQNRSLSPAASALWDLLRELYGTQAAAGDSPVR